MKIITYIAVFTVKLLFAVTLFVEVGFAQALCAFQFKQKTQLKDIHQLFGRRVETPDGTGVVLQVKVNSFNGLYFSGESSTVTVWYGTDQSQNGWVAKTYYPTEIALPSANDSIIDTKTNNIGRSYLKKVKTRDGIGTIIAIKTDFNGLYYEPATTKIQVWYGTDQSQNGWVARLYSINEVSALEESIE